MRLRAMAPSGATGRVCRGLQGDTVECLSPGASCGFKRETYMPIVGRSLIVCTLLAAGFAGSILTVGGDRHTVEPLRVAAPTFVAPAAPRPGARLQLAMATPDLEEEASAAVRNRAWSRIDRVPYEYLLSEAEVGVGDPDEILAFGPMKIRRHLVETILKAARETDADPVLLMAIADKESSFSTGARARTSSATGLFQFIERTWLKVVRDFGAKHGLAKEAAAIAWVGDELTVADAAERARILELRRDPYLSALLAAEMLNRDRARIARRIGRDLTHGETYLAHFLGPDDAERFMEAVVDEPDSVAATLLPKPARANRGIFFARAKRKAKGRSVAEVHQKFEAMMDLRLERYRNVAEVAGVTAFTEVE